MEAQVLLAGLTASCLYAVVALSYFLISKGTRLVNFAVGGYAVFAALAVVRLSAGGWPLLLAVAVALAAASVLAMLTEVLLVAVMQRRQSAITAIEIAIVALLFVLEQTAGLLFGRQPSTTSAWIDGALGSGDLRVTYQTLLTFGVTVAVFAAVALWLQRGRYGRMLRAVGDNPSAAGVLGMPVRRVRLAAMGAAGGAAGLAGVLAVAQSSLTVESGTRLTLLGFVALVLGGMAHVWAPLVGGVLLGLLEAVSARLIGDQVRDYVILALVLVIFTFRPRGLFAVEERT